MIGPRRAIKRWGAAVGFVLAGLAATGAQPGERIPALALQNLYFEAVTLEPVARAHVLFFFSNTCPVARRYMARMVSIDTDYRARGVRVIGINASPADTVPDVAGHALEYNLSFPVLKDADFSAVRTLGITRTPEVVILDSDFVLRYRGRIDDQYRLGGVRPSVSRHDLLQALEAVLEGREVSEPLTRAEGCAITFPMLPTPAPALTYYRDVRPILEEHCTACHYPAGPAPMALDSFDALTGHGDAVLKAVLDRRMPPSLSAGEDTAVLSHDLAPRERHRIANWLLGDRLAGEQESDAADSPPSENWIRLQTRIDPAVPSDPEVVHLQADLPAGGEIWLSAIGVEAQYDTGFAFAEVFAESEAPSGSDRRLTGPILAGEPLHWPEGEAMHIHAGARLALIAHYRAVTGDVKHALPVLLIRRATGAVQREIYCIANEFKSAPDGGLPVVQQLQPGERLHAAAAWIPRGDAATLTAQWAPDSKRTLLSLPAGDPKWPLTYQFSNGARGGDDTVLLRWNHQTPAYLSPPHGTLAPPAAVEAPSGRRAFYLYIARPLQPAVR